MEYTLQIPDVIGETIPLYSVAHAMANRRASAGDKGFHKLSFDTALREFIKVLIHEAEGGRLKVCNQFGMSGTPAEISAAAYGSGIVVKGVDENTTMALHVWAHLHSVNTWAQERGDIFHINSQEVEHVDERGCVRPSEPGNAKESPRTHDCGGAQTAASENDVVVLDKAGPLKVAAKPARRESWFDASLPYLRDTYKAGQYATAKAFYKALESKAGTAGSPFDKGIGINAGSLVVRATSSTLACNTLANKFWPIRNQA